MNDRIELTDFVFDTIVGILPSEQLTPQPLAVEIVMELPLEQTARTGDLAGSINYAAVQRWVWTLARHGSWPLIESLSHAIARLILAPPAACEDRAQVDAVEVGLRKPTILDGAVPGTRIRRTAEWCDLAEVELENGVIKGVLEETPARSAYRIRLEPGARWQVPEYLHIHVVGGNGGASDANDETHALAEGDDVALAPRRTLWSAADGLVVLAVGKAPGASI